MILHHTLVDERIFRFTVFSLGLQGRISPWAFSESITRFSSDQCQVHHSTPMKLDLDLNILSISSTSGCLTTKPFHLLAEASNSAESFDYNRQKNLTRYLHFIYITCLSNSTNPCKRTELFEFEWFDLATFVLRFEVLRSSNFDFTQETI